jgi:hypothetical protein
MDLLDTAYIASIETLHSDALAIGDAALASDFGEARFRTQLVVMGAEALGLKAVVHAAKIVAATLGEAGDPLPGYGAAILGLAKSIRPPAPFEKHHTLATHGLNSPGTNREP